MKGIGTICNFAAVIVAALIGIILKKGIKENIREGIMHTCGLSVIFIGIAGAVANLLTIKNGSLETQKSLLLVISLVIGTALGEWINIEKKMDLLGSRIKSLFKNKDDTGFVDGFVTSSIIICVGAMAVLGPIYDVVLNDPSILFVKSMLDFVIILIIAAVYGWGVLFSSVSLLIYQGIITIAAVFIEPYFTQSMVENISVTGSVIIFCVGYNIAFGKKFRVGNMIFAMFIPVLWEIFYKII